MNIFRYQPSNEHVYFCRWFELRREAESFYGLEPTPKACTARGKRNYVTMDLENAKIPPDSGLTSASHLIPEKLKPLKGAGFDAIDHGAEILRWFP